MSRRCELTGKGAQVGHKVSHSNRKTKRRFLPNLLNVTLTSDALGRSFKLRVSAHAFKTVDHRGGFDAFLMKANDDELSERVPRHCSSIAGPSPPRRVTRTEVASFMSSALSNSVSAGFAEVASLP